MRDSKLHELVWFVFPNCLIVIVIRTETKENTNQTSLKPIFDLKFILTYNR